MMARSAQLRGEDALARFVGATPAARDARTLLAELIDHIAHGLVNMCKELQIAFTQIIEARLTIRRV